MKNIEEIVLEKKEENTLTNIEFVPPKFGLFIITTMLVGIGIGSLINNILLGGLTFGVGIVGMIYSMANRGKW